MKRIFFLLAAAVLVLSGCESTTVIADDGNSFLNGQIIQLKTELLAKRNGNEKLFGPTYNHAMDFSAACKKATEAINVATDMQGVKDALTELRGQTEGLVYNHELIEANAKKEIDFLITKASPANKKMITDQIQLIEYGYLVHFNYIQTNDNFLVNYFEPMLVNPIGASGKPFSSEIIVGAENSTKRYIVRTGEGIDADKKLTGKIDTLSYSDNRIPLFTASNTRPGVYDIPAELICPVNNGKDAVVRFTIHYEIK